MDFQDLLNRAIEIRGQYAELEKVRYGRSWSHEEVVQGFVGDVGDLVKLTMAHSGIRAISDVEAKLAHELADCLWSILMISKPYDVELEQAFLQTMEQLGSHIAESRSHLGSRSSVDA